MRNVESLSSQLSFSFFAILHFTLSLVLVLNLYFMESHNLKSFKHEHSVPFSFHILAFDLALKYGSFGQNL